MAFERIELGDLLLKNGLLTQEQLGNARQYQKTLGGKIAAIIVKSGYISDSQLTQEIARHYGMEVTDLANQILPINLLKAVPKEIIEKHHVIPVHVTDAVLTVAMSDPTDYEALDELQFATGKKIETTLATRQSIEQALSEFLDALKQEEARSKGRPKSAGKLRPASTGAIKALNEATESSLVDDLKGRLNETPGIVTRSTLRSALIPLLLKKRVITEDELYDSVIDLLRRKGVFEQRELVDKAKEAGG